MNINGDKQIYLLDELRDYEKNNELNDEERTAIRKWVSDGHSVHENTWDAEDGHGNYFDFIDVYRDEICMNEQFYSMDDKEKEDFLAQLNGEDTIRTLRKKYDELFFKAEIYEYVLRKHDLLNEAVLEMDAARARSREFEEMVSKEVNAFDKGDRLW